MQIADYLLAIGDICLKLDLINECEYVMKNVLAYLKKEQRRDLASIASTDLTLASVWEAMGKSTQAQEKIREMKYLKITN